LRKAHHRGECGFKPRKKATKARLGNRGFKKRRKKQWKKRLHSTQSGAMAAQKEVGGWEIQVLSKGRNYGRKGCLIILKAMSNITGGGKSSLKKKSARIEFVMWVGGVFQSRRP